ncbi:uncharacterized protein LOC119009503 [Acanthopagrus latus]|uniref:uncharacterized protein LOC119009503 n=1 Tax=Acanthopagrus latus TaxID=8177 RepID=UPI00187C5FFE|nr:uncharacterized protein LOC119009503 [Acanthopagrus latus]
MGQSLSPEERLAELDKYSEAMFDSQQWHGIGIDSSILKYSGLNSTQVLDDYRDQVLYSGDFSDAAAVVEKLGSALGGLKMVPNAVGLGAIIISIILETVGKTLGKESMGTAEMLQRVFAQEKANEVRDLMDEYLKRMRINLGKPQLQLAETRQIETDLSVQLTRLKNSMLRDGHMNSRFLKQWVNGAAFHTQMLIHQARLEGAGGSRAMQAAGIYQQQLNLLLEKYKNYLTTVIFVSSDHDYIRVYCCLRYTENVVFSSRVQCFTALESYCFSGSEIVETMFSKHQMTWAKTYFTDLRAQIPTLVTQDGTFHIQA